MSIEPISRLRPAAWHVPLLLAVSLGFESLFLRHGMNRLDEGWPLYAAKLLIEGGTLYQDVFFVFPPGHLLAAWLGQVLDPPGLLFAREVYLVFNVAACLGVYLLGRRVMPAPYALFGALLLAVGAPDSHLKHLLFGYRYLIIVMLALLAFARRLDTGSLRWSFVAGLATGVAAGIRLTPALATAAAIGIGMVAAGLTRERRPSAWLRDGVAFGIGAAIPVLPLLFGLWLHAGLDAVVLEMIVRPVAMVDQQSLPIPGIELPDEWTRRKIRGWFVGVQYRGYAALYAVYVVTLGARLVRALRRGEKFEHVFLLTLVAWGAIYFIRTLGRSDEPHLDSTLPPTALLLAHAVSQLRRLRWPAADRAQRVLRGGVCTALFAGFAFLSGSDFIAAPEQRGRWPFQSTGGEIVATNPFLGAAVDWCVENVRAWTRPGDTVLDLTASPLLLVLAGRSGPGGAEIVMPATFLDEAEERAFLARLEARPPALVIWPNLPFDHREKRSVVATAPLVSAWVKERYEERGRRGRFGLWAAKGSPPFD